MKRYNSFSEHLKKKHGAKVYKISIDAGFTCPNRGGSVSENGCIYCDETGSRAAYCDKNLSVRDQAMKGMEIVKERYGAGKFIAYFQAFTNTYAKPEELKKIYDEALVSGNIIGLSIGTRPDCVNYAVLDVIESYASRYEVWIELGVQSFSDKTLRLINRGHDAQRSRDAIELIRKRKKINICAHIILGLPGENNDDWKKTAEELSRLGVDGVKLHCLHILKGTAAEDLYKSGEIELMEPGEYVKAVCDFLEHLSPEITIQRLTGEASPERLIAPQWTNNKSVILKMIDEELERRDSRQGKLFR